MSVAFDETVPLQGLCHEKNNFFGVLFETLKMQKNLITIGVYTESTDMIVKAFKKIIHLVALSL
jgi:hypothetical protein